MSLLDTFYPQHLLPTGEQCPVCTDPINLVVCLPPTAGRHLLALAWIPTLGLLANTMAGLGQPKVSLRRRPCHQGTGVSVSAKPAASRWGLWARLPNLTCTVLWVIWMWAEAWMKSR